MSDQTSYQPLISVIMNCYNGEKYLREAIDSVYAQTYKNWEIIFLITVLLIIVQKLLIHIIQK